VRAPPGTLSGPSHCPLKRGGSPARGAACTNATQLKLRISKSVKNKNFCINFNSAKKPSKLALILVQFIDLLIFAYKYGAI
jgi:hypothetical protein